MLFLLKGIRQHFLLTTAIGRDKTGWWQRIKLGFVVDKLENSKKFVLTHDNLFISNQVLKHVPVWHCFYLSETSFHSVRRCNWWNCSWRTWWHTRFVPMMTTMAVSAMMAATVWTSGIAFYKTICASLTNNNPTIRIRAESTTWTTSESTKGWSSFQSAKVKSKQWSHCSAFIRTKQNDSKKE